MAVLLAGDSQWGIPVPGSSDTVEIPVVLVDSSGVPVVGITYNAAGMEVLVEKAGDHTYTAFPSFGTANWVEVTLSGTGRGEYKIILHGNQAGEVALLVAGGTLTVYVK